MNRYLAFPLIAAMAVIWPCASFSQQEPSQQEGIEYSYGVVNKVDAAKNEIVVSEYDWENDIDISVIYSTNSDTKFENVTSLEEIKSGDEISIEYIKDKDNRRIAKFISIYKEEPEEEKGGLKEDIEDVPVMPDIEDVPGIE